MSAHYSKPLARLGKCDSNVERKIFDREPIPKVD